MEIKKPMMEALNKQIQHELASSYIYLGMSAFFEQQDLKGFASWMRIQAEEEKGHALKFLDHIIARGGEVKLLPIDAPKQDWKTPEQAFAQAFSHEQAVTGMINSLYELAEKEKEHATREFLHWFLKEQVEEEEQSREILNKLQQIGDNKAAIFMIDAQLGKRGKD